MANVKNFGLVGVGSDVQLGKAGTRLINNAGTFNFKAANGSTDAALTAAGMTSSGNITLTTGNLVASAAGATISIGGDTTLSRQGAGVFQLNGTAAVMVPSGSVAQRPAGVASMLRYNSDGNTMEFYNGTSWTTLATGGTAVTAVSVASANGFAGTSSGGTTPELTLTTTVTGLLAGAGGAIGNAVSGTDIKTVGGNSLVGAGDALSAPLTVQYGGTGASTLTGYVKGNGTSPFTASATVPAGDISGVLAPANGGTGVNNGTDTITTAGNVSFGGAFTTAGSFTTSGAFPVTQTYTAATNVTFPTSGTLLSTDNISSNAVTTFSAGTTGFSPASATNGAVTLSGTLVPTHGGTGISSFSAGDVLYADGINSWAAAPAGSTSGVQAWDAGLDALAAKATTGILVQTGANTYSSVSLVAPAAGITISSGDGTAGNPTFALADDLAAVEALSGAGYAVRTAANTWTTRVISGFAGRTVVTNGDGILSNTDIDLATVTDSGTGTFLKFTRDAYGRVSGTTSVTTGDITALVDSEYVNITGDTMTGNLNMGTNFVTMANPPTLDTHAANKAYVDSVAAGLSWKDPAQAATVSNLNATYNNGASGVGATLTNAGTQVALSVDGVALVVNDRVLVKDQTSTFQNGIYRVTTVGDGSTDWVLTRTVNMDAPGEFFGAAVLVTNGTVNDNTGWTQTEIVNTVGTDAVLWTQFSGSNTYIWGDGLGESGNTIFVKTGAGITILPADEVGIDIESGKAVQLTGGLSGDQLTFVLDGAGITSGLTQSASGLKIAAGGVTNSMLVNNFIGFNSDSGTSNQALGTTLLIQGTSGQGISTSVSGSTMTITAADASAAQKGVASFTAGEFTTTSGNVALGLVPVTKGGTGFASYTVGDILYADTPTSLAKRAVGAAGTVLRGGTTPTWGAVNLTSDVTGVLPAANGGTGVANSNTITLGGNILTAGALTTTGAFATTFNFTGATNVTFPTSGTLATVGSTVSSFSGGSTGLTPNTATTGAITLGGTLVVANGGTGQSTLGANQVMVGNGTSAVLTSSALTFASSILTVGTGSTSLLVNGATNTIATASGSNANINLVPDGTGSVVIGPAGAGLIQSDAGQALTVQGNTTLTLTSVSGSTSMALPAGTTAKVSVTGPTPAQYATGLAAGDLVNKEYVDTIAGSASGDIKAYKATVNLGINGTTNIGSALPAGATVLSVKVQVTSTNTTSTLSVGKSGGASDYMTAAENDPQTTGLYMAETYVTEGSSTQVIATVAAQTGAVGSANVIVTYQIA